MADAVIVATAARRAGFARLTCAGCGTYCEVRRDLVQPWMRLVSSVHRCTSLRVAS